MRSMRSYRLTHPSAVLGLYSSRRGQFGSDPRLRATVVTSRRGGVREKLEAPPGPAFALRLADLVRDLDHASRALDLFCLLSLLPLEIRVECSETGKEKEPSPIFFSLLVPTLAIARSTCFGGITMLQNLILHPLQYCCPARSRAQAAPER
jgi:hypothetical protein